jgi:hypothetical protein
VPTEIAHTPIDDTLENYYFPARPELPVEGVVITCPNCSTTSTYAKQELVYMSDRVPSRFSIVMHHGSHVFDRFHR